MIKIVVVMLLTIMLMIPIMMAMLLMKMLAYVMMMMIAKACQAIMTRTTAGRQVNTFFQGSVPGSQHARYITVGAGLSAVSVLGCCRLLGGHRTQQPPLAIVGFAMAWPPGLTSSHT